MSAVTNKALENKHHFSQGTFCPATACCVPVFETERNRPYTENEKSRKTRLFLIPLFMLLFNRSRKGDGTGVFTGILNRRGGCHGQSLGTACSGTGRNGELRIGNGGGNGFALAFKR